MSAAHNPPAFPCDCPEGYCLPDALTNGGVCKVTGQSRAEKKTEWACAANAARVLAIGADSPAQRRYWERIEAAYLAKIEGASA